MWRLNTKPRLKIVLALPVWVSTPAFLSMVTHGYACSKYSLTPNSKIGIRYTWTSNATPYCTIHAQNLWITERKTVILSGTIEVQIQNMVKKSYEDKVYLDKMPHTLPSGLWENRCHALDPSIDQTNNYHVMHGSQSYLSYAYTMVGK